ncbi:hypothetical protein M707_02755 [Arthrobacter sp. AK-YN10]|nr:hypothetical protein M707_02755 [Arthrobacter sp. AK-YN10]
MLEFAYTLYLDSTCDVCGGNRFECRNEANAGLYEVAETTCQRQAAVEEHTGQKNFKPDPGQRFYATEIDEELITRRPVTVSPRLDAAADE